MSNLNKWMSAYRYEMDDGTTWLVYQTYESMVQKELFWVAEAQREDYVVQLGPFQTAQDAMAAADAYRF